MQVAFEALIKQISVKSLVSGDKEAQIILRFLPTDEVLDGLNRLHRADEGVMVAIVPLDINNRLQGKNVIPKRKKREPGGTAEGDAE